MSRLSGDWKEIKPAVFELKGYSSKQIERLDRRPTDLIKRALGSSAKVQDDKVKKR
ncbi:hypothetical protein J4G48_0046990 [Bradyrhizobium barranii subsp. apii]|uniref:hypothetical protein n=1 Tax=Bradyrhizobium barranii TaxID=2992140 RepID=UPI001AA176B2|nr:hypothetical protein [Bradyrhizobium barranii]UPT96470.1 hypothetical protein J4G48_0046990 [Bradyrhizobium barranii subsp. apii]